MIDISTKTKKESGAHYTPTELANFVSKQIIANYSTKNNKTIRVLDPAVGDGELLLSLTAILYKNDITNFELNGFDTNSQAIKIAQYRIKSQYPALKINLMASDFLQFVVRNYVNHGLFQDNNLEPFDLIITNPPYVRTQVLGADKSRDLARIFNLSGRVDLYHAFLKALTYVLAEHGTAGIIVSNRFMYIRSGEAIRKDLLSNFEIKGILETPNYLKQRFYLLY
ncbi:MAG: N-6 DNA methylase [Actinobacteria bacterium]|nr:N-6 DNA methylase [Actinomycetota bacterium]